MPHATLPDAPTCEQVLEELNAAAEADDLTRLREALTKWHDSVTDVSQLPLTMPNMFLRITHQLPDKTLALQRVLSTAAKTGHARIAAHLLDEEGCVVSPPVVRWALSRKRWDVMEVYMARGWDINSPVEGGNTCSVLKEVLPSEIHVRWCLEHGADPMMRSAGGNNDIPSYAGRFGSVNSMKAMREYGADFAKSNALHSAAASPRPKRAEVMTYLLDEVGVPVNQLRWEYDQKYFDDNKSMGFGTALHCAVAAKCLDNARLLIAKGVDKDMRDTKGRRAVDIARDNSFDEGVALLEN